MDRLDRYSLRYGWRVLLLLCLSSGCSSEPKSKQNRLSEKAFTLGPGIRLDEKDLSVATGIMFIPGDPDGEWVDLIPIDDSDIAQVAKAIELRNLTVGESNVTSAGFAALEGLTRLESVHAWDTKIDDAALKYLADSKELKELWLRRTRITNAGVEYLVEHFPALEDLDLSETLIDDQAVASLAKLKQLTRLDLSRTKITDASVPALSKMKQL
ncbi:MAG: hypothetical protein WD851_10450 [Pirellulales bacterium]